MVSAKTGEAGLINEMESIAYLTHYYDLVLETIKTMKIMRGTLDATFELNKFQIHSKK